MQITQIGTDGQCTSDKIISVQKWQMIMPAQDCQLFLPFLFLSEVLRLPAVALLASSTAHLDSDSGDKSSRRCLAGPCRVNQSINQTNKSIKFIFQ